MNPQIKDIERNQGIRYLGKNEVDLEVALTDEDRIQFGREQANALYEAAQVEARLKDVNSKLKSEMQSAFRLANALAQLIHFGKKNVKEHHHCFYDPRRLERVYIDLETGEEVARKPASHEDAQASFDEILREKATYEPSSVVSPIR